MPKVKNSFLTETGWSADTGTADKTSRATFAGQTISVIPLQGEVQTIDDRVVILSRQIKSLKDALLSLGLIEA